MSDYIKGTRVTLDVVLAKEYEYMDYAFNYCGTHKFIYTLKNAEGNTFVWKTGVVIGYDKKSDNGTVEFIPVYLGDKIQVVASIKELSEYKGKPQIVLTRVKVKKVLERALTKSEKEEIKREQQLALLGENDMIYEMPYRQYKEHYSDCETLSGSYYKENANSKAIISVIIRDGRLKASGTRFKHYSGYEFEDENGERVCYRAINEENALKRANKEYPNRKWSFAKKYSRI